MSDPAARSRLLKGLCEEVTQHARGLLEPLDELLETDLSERQLELVRVARRKGGEVLGVVGDVMDVYHPESSGEKSREEMMSVRETLEGILGEFEPRRGDAVEFELVLEERLENRDVYADRTRYAQIIRNLLSNAVTATKEGWIRIRAAIAEEDTASYLVRTEVIDTGIGISAEDPAVLFQGDAREGISSPRRGLRICHALAACLGGDIGMHTNPETRGSVFWATVRMAKEAREEPQPARSLPVREPESQGRPEATMDALKAIAPSKHVLIAEDNPVNQRVMLHVLKQLGFNLGHVDVANDGAQAVQLCRREPFLYNLVLMDVSMPVMDGLQATREIRALGRRVVVVAVTAATGRQERERLLERGMDDCVWKPVRRGELAEVLMRWL